MTSHECGDWGAGQREAERDAMPGAILPLLINDFNSCKPTDPNTKIFSLYDKNPYNIDTAGDNSTPKE